MKRASSELTRTRGVHRNFGTYTIALFFGIYMIPASLLETVS